MAILLAAVNIALGKVRRGSLGFVEPLMEIQNSSRGAHREDWLQDELTDLWEVLMT